MAAAYSNHALKAQLSARLAELDSTPASVLGKSAKALSSSLDDTVWLVIELHSSNLSKHFCQRDLQPLLASSEFNKSAACWYVADKLAGPAEGGVFLNVLSVATLDGSPRAMMRLSRAGSLSSWPADTRPELLITDGLCSCALHT